MKEYHTDMCSLSEIKQKSKGNIKIHKYIFIYSGKEKNARATYGIGLLVHQRFDKTLRMQHTSMKEY